MTASTWLQQGILMGLCALGSLRISAEHDPGPYLGIPFVVPGRIEAEYWDRGGEGVGYHFSGRPIAPLFWRYGESQGRPGEAMVATEGRVRAAVLQSGEWLGYSISCATEGYYSILLKTFGPPGYFASLQGEWGSFCSWRDGSAFLHVEVDGQRFSSPQPVSQMMVLPRVWLSQGPHRLRLVAGQITDTMALQQCEHYPLMGTWEYSCVMVDWLDLLPAPLPLGATPVAGGPPGFQDGPGPEARLAGRAELLGETSSGDVVFLDGAAPAVRLLRPDGSVHTLAGRPGNLVRDGIGADAGLGIVLDAVWTPGERVLLLEDSGHGERRIRKVDPAGEVTTLFAGTATVTLEDIRYGKESLFPPIMTNRPAPLSRLVIGSEGEIQAVASLSDYLYTIGPGPFQPPVWRPYTRHVWFRISDATATPFEVSAESEFLNGGSGPVPPPRQPRDLGLNVRFDGDHFGRLLTESPPGFVHDLLPGRLVFSALRSREGHLYASIEPGIIHRLSPDGSLVRLTVGVDGPGSVSEISSQHLAPGSEVSVTATPTGLFAVFEGWSDGSTERSRTVRIERDLWITARFAIRPPEPSGILPGTIRLLSQRQVEFSVAGILDSQYYRMEESDNLRDWSPAKATLTLVPSGHAVPAARFTIHVAEARVRARLEDTTRWYRLVRVDQ